MKAVKKKEKEPIILKSVIELNDILFETNEITTRFEPFKSGELPNLIESTPYFKNHFKISKLKIEIETTDQVTSENFNSLLELLRNQYDLK